MKKNEVRLKGVMGAIIILTVGVMAGYVIAKAANAWRKFWAVDYGDEDLDMYCGSDPDAIDETTSAVDVGTVYHELPRGKGRCCEQPSESEGGAVNNE